MAPPEPQEWQQRLRDWLHDHGMSQKVLADTLGKSEEFVSNLLTGRKHYPPEISETLSGIGVDLHWILAGKKQARAAETAGSYLTLGSPGVLAELKKAFGQIIDVRSHIVWREAGETEIEPDDYVAVPVLADAAAAGAGRLMSEDVEEYALIHRRALSHPDNVRCVRVRGDSMEPTLPDGSIVAVDTALKNIEKAVGRIVCARLDPEEVVIKRLWWGHDRQYVVLEPEDASQQHERIAIDLTVSPEPLIGTIVWAWVDLSHRREGGP